MSKFRSGKRYADVLTVLLVIIILAILGLLGYFGYKAIDKKKVETNAESALEEFKQSVASPSKKENTNSVVEEPSNIDQSVSLSNLVSTPNTNSNEQVTTPQKAKKKTYLGNYEIKGSINIPKIKCEYPILEKVTVDSLKKSVAILDIVSASELNQTVTDLNVPGSNALILGHNYHNGLFFSNNDNLTKGDKIKITDQTGTTLTYTIYDMFYTTPNDISFMERELDVNKAEITLQTCNDDSSERLIIFARAD